MALLALAHQWHQLSGRSLQVFTVDHALRPEAADEADSVADRCRDLGLTHAVLKWDAPRPSQNAARSARYTLLSDAARAAGADCILTGHTFDDIVETAMIRRRRGVRSSAIAAPHMAAPMPVWPIGRGLTLLRPLLSARRHSLRAHLQRLNWQWKEDPSNSQRVFERVRVRNFLARHPHLSGVADGFVRTMQGQAQIDQFNLGAELLKVDIRADGLIDTATARISPTLLRVLARCASGGDSDPRAEAIYRLLATLRDKGQRETLGGAWFQRTHSGFLIGRAPDTPAVTTGGLFDGRYEHSQDAKMDGPSDVAFLVRHAVPSEANWKEVISERLKHLALCYQTPRLNPVQR